MFFEVDETREEVTTGKGSEINSGWRRERGASGGCLFNTNFRLEIPITALLSDP